MDRALTMMAPARGRLLIVEINEGSFDFTMYLSELGVTVSGLVPNPRAKVPQLN